MRLRNSLLFFTVTGAMACAFFGTKEYYLAARSSEQPEEISLRDLIKRGPEGNPYIILKDFSLLDEYIGNKKLLSSRWTKVWVPIVPTEEDEAPANQRPAIHAFLYGENFDSDEEVSRRFGQVKLRGMIDSKASEPGIFANVLIKKHYPGTDPNKCIIIVEGKKPAGVLKLGLYGVGCVLLLGLSGVIWYLARLLDQPNEGPKLANKNQLGDRKQNGHSEPIIHVLPIDDEGPIIIKVVPIYDVDPIIHVLPIDDEYHRPKNS